MESQLTLPISYKEFLKYCNGGDGLVGANRYVILWRLEELLKLNGAYQTQEFAPGLLLFGTNGGGEAYAFDMRSCSTPIVSVPFVGMAVDTVRPICGDFDVFLRGNP
jgi:hypothetical protein